MKNKQLKKAVAVGTLGVVSVTTTVNPIASAYAEQVPGDEDLEVDNVEVQSVNLLSDKTYTMDDIGVSASLTSGVTVENGVLSYTKGINEGVNIAATVLDAGVNITSVQLIYEGPGFTDTYDNSEESSAFGGLLDLGIRDEIEITGIQLVILLSNGQRLTTDLSTIIPELSGVTSVKPESISVDCFDFSVEFVGNTAINNGILYYNNTDDLDAGIRLTCVNNNNLPITLDHSGLGLIRKNNDIRVFYTPIDDCILFDRLGYSLEELDLSDCCLTEHFFDAQGYETSATTESKTLAEILGVDSLTEIKKDTTAPTIAYESTTALTADINDKTYVVKDGVHAFKVSDDESGYGSVISVKVKGTDTDVAYTYSDGIVYVNTNQFSNGSHEITITASDGVGNKGTLDYTVNVQKNAPVLKGFSHTNATSYDGKSYVQDSLDVYVGSDSDVNNLGDSIELYKDGNLCASGDVAGSRFTINSNGVYTVKVTDKLGNSTTYNLGDLFNDLESEIIVDSEAPTCTTKITSGTKVGDWYTGNTFTLNTQIEDDVLLKEVIVSVNGKETKYSDLYSKTLTANTFLDACTKPSDGIFKVTVKAEDVSGRVYNLDNYILKYDNDAPIVDLSANGNIVESNNKVYIDGDVVIGETNNCSDVSGIKSIELVKDGTVVSSTLPFTISDNGEYSIKVTDNVGLITEVPLSDLLGTVSNELVFDGVAPKVTRVEGFTPDKVVSNVNWYKTEPTFKLKVEDDNLLSKNISVVGCDDYEVTSENDCFVVKTNGAKGNLILKVTARDYFGHTTEDDYYYSVDGDAPTVSRSALSESYVERDGKLYFKKAPTVSIETSDGGIGTESIILSGDKSESNNTGVFQLGSGSYFVEIKDKLGNTTGVKSLAEVLGLSSNVFVVDSVGPTITTNRPSGDSNGWYSGNVSYSIGISDDTGIKSATVSINNQVVESYTLRDDEDIKSFTATADTSRVEANANGIYQVKVEAMDKSGNVSTWSDTIYIDKTAPTVDKFVFTGNGSQEGVEINGTSRYGFFFNGSATCEVHVSDGTVSSGLGKLYATLENQDGSKTEQSVNIVNGVATISIPNNFKGFVSAYAIDNVGNKGSVNSPDGIITEDSNCFINNLAMSINLPDTSSQDIAGIPLYNKDITATAEIGNNYSGIKNVTWGIGDNTLGNVDVDVNGKASGDTATIKQMGKNLVLNLSQQLNIQGNSNGQTVWVKVTDRSGHTSTTSRVFSIDKDAPVISVSYDNSNASNYYNQNRVAKITVKERNFDASKFSVSGASGSLGTWSNDGDVWTNTITFSEDGEYQFILNCTDRAGNVASSYSSERFIVDKTSPVLTVTWNNDSPSNGNFYKNSRTATVTVVDKNFDANLYSIQGNGTFGNWSSNGDTHTSTITFDSDGEYEFSISGQDMAGNKAQTYSSGKFIIDKTVPTVGISGVQDMVSYKGDVSLAVKLADSYIDTSKTVVTLEGKRNGSLRLVGTVNEQSGELTFSDFPKDEKYDDIYTLKANVVDKAGNITEETLTFSVNRFGSTYTFVDSDILNTYLNKAKNIEIIESNVDKLDTSKAKVSIIRDGSEIAVDSKYITITESDGEDGKYNYSYVIDKKAFDKDGKYLIQIYSHAEEGTDYSSVSEEYSFVLDTVKPEIIVSGVESNKQYHEYEKKVTIDVRDMSGINEIHVTLNGKDVNLDKSNGVYSFKISESSGPQNLVVTVTDKAGNTSTVEVSKFLVTSSTWVFLINQLWFKLGIGALIAFIAAIIALLFKHRHTARKEENEVLRQNMELFRASSSTGGSSSGEKDMVEDLEKSDKDSEK